MILSKYGRLNNKLEKTQNKQTNTNETPNTFKPSIKCILFLLQLFYIFIYSVSISFLIFVYVFLLRKRSGEIIRQAVRRLSFHDSQPIFRRVVTFSNVGHSGGFYLRLGAIGNERFKASEWQYMNVQMKTTKISRRVLFWQLLLETHSENWFKIKEPQIFGSTHT